MSIHIVLFLFTKIIPMSCHQHFAHSAWKLLPKKLFRKIIPRCNLHIGIISDGGGHENDYRLVLKFCWKSTLGTLRTQSLQIDTNCFSNFLGTQHQAPDKVHSLVVIFLAKTELALFKNQVATDWFIFFLALQNGSAQPLQKN